MKKIVLIALSMFLLLSLWVYPQKKLTLEDASGMNRGLYPAYLRKLKWEG